MRRKYDEIERLLEDLNTKTKHKYTVRAAYGRMQLFKIIGEGENMGVIPITPFLTSNEMAKFLKLLLNFLQEEEKYG